MIVGVLFLVASTYLLALPFRTHVRASTTEVGAQIQVDCGSALHYRFANRNGISASARAHACLRGLSTRRYASGALVLAGLGLVFAGAFGLPTAQQSHKSQQPPPDEERA